MLTYDEILVTVIALLGVGYNAIIFAERRGEGIRSSKRILLYAILVILPQLYVILYAFLQFAAD